MRRGSKSAPPSPDLKKKTPWFLRSKRSIFVALFLSLAVPMSLLTVLIQKKIYHTVEEQAVYENRLAVRLVARTLEEHFQGLIAYAESYAARLSMLDSLGDSQKDSILLFLKQMKTQNPLVDRIFITDAAGIELYDFPHDPAVIGKDFSGRDWYKGAKRNREAYLSGIYKRAAVPQAYIVAAAMPIGDKENPLGYLVVQEKVEQLTSWLSRIKPAVFGSFFVLDQHGMWLRDYDADGSLIEGVKVFRPLTEGDVRDIDPETKKEFLASYVPIRPYGWTAIARQPVESVFASIADLKTALFLLSLIFFTVMLTFSYLWMGLLNRYHEALAAQTGRLKKQSEGLKRAEEDLRETDETLIRKTAELAKSNTEREQLEFFAYVASHDLQEPLQAIIGFSELLKKNNPELTAENAGFLTRIQEAARRMSRLIDDLLSFSKTIRRPELFEKVSLKKILEEVAEDYHLLISKTGAQVEIGELPTIQADELQMRQLFQNLLSNALKFRQEGRAPRIRVHSRALADGSHEISFQDNGIGFDEKQGARIFKPFERLHSRREYEGTGIGLAICQKIILNHAGSIQVKSEVGAGTTFFIHLQETSWNN